MFRILFFEVDANYALSVSGTVGVLSILLSLDTGMVLCNKNIVLRNNFFRFI